MMSSIAKHAVAPFLLLMLLLGAVSARGGVIAPELLEKLKGGAPGQEHAVIVRLMDRVDSRALKASVEGDSREVRLARVVAALQGKAGLAQQGITPYLEARGKEGRVREVKPFWIFNGFSLKGTAEAIEGIASRADVADVVPDRVYRLAAPVTAAATPYNGWNLDQIGAQGAWSLNIKGQGVVVASLDTGVDIKHQDLKQRWRGGSNSWCDPKNEHPTVPFDNDGHGTGVMGVMVGGSASGTPIGVAPRALWMAAKIFDDAGDATDSAIHQAFQWLLAPGPSCQSSGNPADAPAVVNNSWDFGPGLDKTFEDDVKALKAAGIEVVFAAGNDGSPVPPATTTSSSPANYPESLSVGSTNWQDLVSSFSSRGPSAYDGISIYPVLTAPGEHIRTAGLTQSGATPNSYVIFSGTSFSSPHVAGAIALLKSAQQNSANPKLTGPQMEQALKDAAVKLGTPIPNNDYGYGRLNVGRAVTNLGLKALQIPTGIVNPAPGKTQPDMDDALTILKAVVGLIPKTADIAVNGDVAPLVNGVPQPDGTISVLDALVILKLVVGTIPYW